MKSRLPIIVLIVALAIAGISFWQANQLQVAKSNALTTQAAAEADTQRLQTAQTALAVTMVAVQVTQDALPRQVASTQTAFALEWETTRQAAAADYDQSATQVAATLEPLQTQFKDGEATLHAQETVHWIQLGTPSTPPALVTAEAQGTQLSSTLSAVIALDGTLLAVIKQATQSSPSGGFNTLSSIDLTQFYKEKRFAFYYPADWEVRKNPFSDNLEIVNWNSDEVISFIWKRQNPAFDALNIINDLRNSLADDAEPMTFSEPESFILHSQPAAVAVGKNADDHYMVLIVIDRGKEGFLILLGDQKDGDHQEFYNLLMDIANNSQANPESAYQPSTSASSIG